MGIQIHRLSDSVALYVGTGGATVYLSPVNARAIADALTRCAGDVETLDASQSEAGTFDLPLSKTSQKPWRSRD